MSPCPWSQLRMLLVCSRFHPESVRHFPCYISTSGLIDDHVLKKLTGKKKIPPNQTGSTVALLWRALTYEGVRFCMAPENQDEEEKHRGPDFRWCCEEELSNSGQSWSDHARLEKELQLPGRRVRGSALWATWGKGHQRWNTWSSARLGLTPCALCVFCNLYTFRVTGLYCRGGSLLTDLNHSLLPLNSGSLPMVSVSCGQLKPENTVESGVLSDFIHTTFIIVYCYCLFYY